MGFKIVRFKGSDDEVAQQWRDFRKTGLGGSEAATILGLNQYRSPLGLWLEKTGREEPADLSDNESVYWGNQLEDMVAREFAKRHQGWKVERRNCTYVNDEHTFMHANIDRIIRKPDGSIGILEIKTCGQNREADWETGVPDYYSPQPLHYMAVTGYSFAYVAVLIGGNRYREYEMTYDAEDMAALVSRETEFWNMVESDTMPELVGHRSEGADLTTYYGLSDDSVGWLDMDDYAISSAIEAYETAVAGIKVSEDVKRDSANLLKRLIGDNKAVENELMRITWVRSSKSRFDAKAFREDHPELYSKYCRMSVEDGGIRIKQK